MFLYNRAMTGVWSTGAGSKCLYCMQLQKAFAGVHTNVKPPQITVYVRTVTGLSFYDRKSNDNVIPLK